MTPVIEKKENAIVLQAKLLSHMFCRRIYGTPVVTNIRKALPGFIRTAAHH